MAVEEGHAEIVSILTGAGADLKAMTDQNVSAWLVVHGECIVHTHRSPYIESVSSPNIAVTTHYSLHQYNYVYIL